MKWTRETVQTPDGKTLETYRTITARHGSTIAVVVACAVADPGRWHGWTGSYTADTATIATSGAYHGSWLTSGRAKRALTGWAEGA